MLSLLAPGPPHPQICSSTWPRSSMAVVVSHHDMVLAHISNCFTSKILTSGVPSSFNRHFLPFQVTYSHSRASSTLVRFVVLSFFHLLFSLPSFLKLGFIIIVTAWISLQTQWSSPVTWLTWTNSSLHTLWAYPVALYSSTWHCEEKLISLLTGLTLNSWP